MKKHILYTFALAYLGLVIFVSCKKDEQVPENPFDIPDIKAPAPTPSN